MDNFPTICVVVPHLNQSQALEKCLTSLKNQSYSPDLFEVLVVDNGSTGEPSDIVASFDRVRLDRELIPGPGPARNRGAALTSMDVLAFIDADCIADSAWLETIGARFSNGDGPPILGGDVRIAVVDRQRLTALEAYESVFAYRQREYIENQGFSGTGNLAVRRSDFNAIGPFGGIHEAEDRAWGRRAASRGFDVAYVPDMVVYHPARHTFDEIAVKWDRHIRHDYADWMSACHSRGTWLLRAVAVAGSGLIDVRRVVASNRITGFGTRIRAAILLIQVRLYRGWKMIQIARKPEEVEDLPSWNRPMDQP